MTVMLRDREQLRWLEFLQQGEHGHRACVMRCATALAVLATLAIFGANGVTEEREVAMAPALRLQAPVEERAAGHRRGLFDQRRRQFVARTASAGNDDRAIALSIDAEK